MATGRIFAAPPREEPDPAGNRERKGRGSMRAAAPAMGMEEDESPAGGMLRRSVERRGMGRVRGLQDVYEENGFFQSVGLPAASTNPPNHGTSFRTSGGDGPDDRSTDNRTRARAGLPAARLDDDSECLAGTANGCRPKHHQPFRGIRGRMLAVLAGDRRTERDRRNRDDRGAHAAEHADCADRVQQVVHRYPRVPLHRTSGAVSGDQKSPRTHQFPGAIPEAFTARTPRPRRTHPVRYPTSARPARADADRTEGRAPRRTRVPVSSPHGELDSPDRFDLSRTERPA